jgi:hypothetical protein
MVVPGTLAAHISGPGRRTERYHCSFGLNPAYLETLTRHGLVFSGFDDTGQGRIAELPGHPFFLGTLFQPELHGDGTHPHPVIRAFAVAAAAHATAAAATGAATGAGRPLPGRRVPQQDEVVGGDLHRHVTVLVDQLGQRLDDAPVGLAR